MLAKLSLKLESKQTLEPRNEGCINYNIDIHLNGDEWNIFPSHTNELMSQTEVQSKLIICKLVMSQKRATKGSKMDGT